MSAHPEVLAIIPARGGSKGIPRKNVRPLGGIPLIAHTIRQAVATPSITRIVVSTDDAEIGAVAREHGAEVVWRPAELSGDTASSESALLHVLETLREREGYEPSLVVFLQATSPLRRPDDIERAIETVRREKADSLFSACRVEGFVWRRTRGKDDLASFSYDHNRRPRRQDAPEDLIENGSIYVFRPNVLLEQKNRLGGRIAVHLMSPLDSFQIDEPEDLEVMERLLATRGHSGADERLANVKLLVLDFDGVLTDNRVWVDQDGRESVACNRSDGWGIARLREAGVQLVVLSTEQNPVVAARCRKLKVECIQGCDDKRTRLEQLLEERGLSASQVAYVGNDVNDLACMESVGVAIAVADAESAVRAIASLVTARRGGHGAVREVCDWILEARRRRASAPDGSARALDATTDTRS